MMSQNIKVECTICAGGIDEIEGVFTCGTDNVIALRDAIEKCLNANTGVNRMYFDGYL